MAKTKQTAIRLSDVDQKIIDALVKKKGVGMSAVIIIALREMAEREGVKIPDDAELV